MSKLVVLATPTEMLHLLVYPPQSTGMISNLSSSCVKVNACTNVGVYGKITTVKLKASNNEKLFAMKIIDKSKIKEESLLQSSYLQTGILTDDNPFVVKILHVSQNKANIYIVMEYVPGLDLYYYLYEEAKKDKAFSEETVKQIAAEAILGL